MPIFSASTLGNALAAFILLAPAAVGGADNPPPYTSATEAYRQGASAMKDGEVAAAVPALEYAAKRGVLGAQLKLARLYASGQDVPKDDAKAFYYFQRIADQYADIPSSSPIAKYVGEVVRRARSVLCRRHPGHVACSQIPVTPPGCSVMPAPISAMPRPNISLAGSILPGPA